MSSERWRKIEELYHAARERDPGERNAFLAGACLGDEALRREVEALLAQDSDGQMLDSPASKELAKVVAAKSFPRATSLGTMKLPASLARW